MTHSNVDRTTSESSLQDTMPFPGSSIMAARCRAFDWTTTPLGAQIEAALTHGESTWSEDQLVPIERNGRLEDVWWTYAYSPVRTGDGKISGVLVVVHETTNRVMLERRMRRDEARMLELFRHAPAFICVLRGPAHIYEMANDAFQQLIGFRDVVGLPAREAVPEAEGQGFFELLDDVLATGRTVVGNEVPIRLRRSPDHALEERFTTFVFQAITEEDDTRSGVFVHGVDVTDSVKARAIAKSANREE